MPTFLNIPPLSSLAVVSNFHLFPSSRSLLPLFSSEGMDGGLVNRTATTTSRSQYSSWWWNSQSSSHHSQWLQSTLSELDQNATAMLTLIQQQEGDSFAQRAEMYYQKRPELVKRLEDFRGSFNSLAEYFGQLSIRSSLSSCSLKHQENFPLSDKEDAGKNKEKKMESLPNSNPESYFTEEDPLVECTVNGIDQLGSLSKMNKFNMVPTYNISMVDDQSTVTMETEVCHKKLDGHESGWEMAGDCEGTVGSLEHRISFSEQMSRHTEDILNELVRRNEDKRAANQQLQNEIEKLMKENCALQQQFDNVMDENWELHSKLCRLRDENSILQNCPRCSTKNTKKQNGFLSSRLKALFFGNHLE